MQTRTFVAAVLASLLSTASAEPLQIAQPPIVAKRAAQGKIQIAILLDTSGSMDGLINQARTRLWSIVSELGKGTRNGRRPIIELALYEYGKQSLEASDGYIRRIMPLSRDLDGLAEQLFALTTNGGDEYAGWVIQRATNELSWSTDPRDVRLLFIAGNEGFDQGSVPFGKSIAAARKKGVVVNTIYCGGEMDPESKLWRVGANTGAGSFAMVNHNAAVVEIASPYDAELQRLSAAINSTYVAYGPKGAANSVRQKKMDSAAEAAGAPSARAAAKASAAYSNAEWDLVDAGSNVDVGKLEAAQLPPEMRNMNNSERKAHVARKAAERKAMQAKIAELSKKREAFVSAKRKAVEAAPTMDDTLVKAAKSAAASQGYSF